MRKTVMQFLAAACVWGLGTGCWDQTEHEYDFGDSPVSTDSSGNDSDSQLDTATDTGSAFPDSDTDSNAVVVKRNSLLTAEWGGFGSGCADATECTGYPAEEKRCILNVMGLVDSPGGYCTACCNTPGEGVCAQGIDCVGANNAYLVCLERCQTDADCRTADHYICHEGLYYMETIFTGKYCLPAPEYVVPDAGAVDNMTCPWPWS